MEVNLHCTIANLIPKIDLKAPERLSISSRVFDQCRLLPPVGLHQQTDGHDFKTWLTLFLQPPAEYSLPLLAHRALRHARTRSYELSRLGLFAISRRTSRPG